MSIKIMTAVWDREDLSSTQKLVLLALADWANDEGLCWPSINRLAIKASLTSRAVQKTIRSLEDAGFIRREEVLGKGNRYWISTPLNEVHPCTTFTLPLNEVHPTPAPRSPNTSMIHQLTTKCIKEPLPDWLPLDAWNGWVAMRKQRKRPLTDRATARAINKLDVIRNKGHDIEDLLDRSTINGWLDIYEPKDIKNGASNRTTNQRGNQNGFAAALRYVADGRTDDPF
jgi:DNA-binding Lrp family transcriptional regulator